MCTSVCVCVGGGGKRAHWEGEHDDVAMAAAATTVYLTALLNLIQPITNRIWMLYNEESLELRMPGSSTGCRDQHDD